MRRIETSKVYQFVLKRGFVCIIVLAGCGDANWAPLVSRETYIEMLQVFSDGEIVSDPTSRSTHYIVRKGDTLRGIAWRHALPYDDFVTWNRIVRPDLIKVGTTLRLAALTSENDSILAPKTEKVGQGSKASIKEVFWGWPSVPKQFARSELGSGRGITINGAIGTPVKAAASGVVVYGGNGLRGYGELLIIQHGANFLSAYGHNDRRLVSEGDFVTLGETIATMGKTESKEVKLYFEIRHRGKPVNVLNYLPGK